MMSAHYSTQKPNNLRILPVLPPRIGGGGGGGGGGGVGMDPQHLSSYPIQPGPSTNYLRSQNLCPTQVVIDGMYDYLNV